MSKPHKPQPRKPASDTDSSAFGFLLKNFLVTAVLLIAVYAVKENYTSMKGPDGQEYPGSYKWAYEVLAKKNLEQIDDIRQQEATGQIPKLTREEKLKYKIACYGYIDYILKNTPKDAVILLPPGDSLNGKQELNFLYSSEWVEYFVYPRLCVSEVEKDRKPELYKRATHVAIVEGWGYSKLKYAMPAEGRPQMALLPINEPPAPKNQ